MTANVFQYIPYILQAINLASDISRAHKSGASVLELFQRYEPASVDLLIGIAAKWFPHIDVKRQAEAGAAIMDTAQLVRVQEALNKNGFRLLVDGVFGGGTKTAIQKYQSDHGLKTDGWPGPATLEALGLVAR